MCGLEVIISPFSLLPSFCVLLLLGRYNVFFLSECNYRCL